jgi:mevalonate kinase
MIKKTIDNSQLGYSRRRDQYFTDPIYDDSSKKKENIVKILDEGNQLTLLGTVVEQIGDSLGINTPEFIKLKSIYSSIRNELGR